MLQSITAQCAHAPTFRAPTFRSMPANDNLTSMQLLKLHSEKAHIRAELAEDDLSRAQRSELLRDLCDLEILLESHQPRPRPILRTVH